MNSKTVHASLRNHLNTYMVCFFVATVNNIHDQIIFYLDLAPFPILHAPTYANTYFTAQLPISLLAKTHCTRPVVVAQLVERLLLTPEVRSSNPVIVINLYWTFFCQLYWKGENKVKEAGFVPFLKNTLHVLFMFCIESSSYPYLGRQIKLGSAPVNIACPLNATWTTRVYLAVTKIKYWNYAIR